MKSNHNITIGKGMHPFLGPGNRIKVTVGEGPLARHLEADPDAREAARRFVPRIPRAFAQCIDWNDPEDPLLRQVLPSGAELEEREGFLPDPLDEAAVTPVPGLLHKYRDRVLLTVTHSCSIHCRFCFRRHQLQRELPDPTRLWEQGLAWVAGREEIREVILSGGEPLLIPDAELEELVQTAAAIPHLQRLRIHTRSVVALPERIGHGLTRILTATRLMPWMVLHVNHPAELGVPQREAITRLRRAGIPMLQQGVLLRGVNDRLEVLASLMERLTALGVTPYYLHLLDPVAGATHFLVPEEEGVALIQALRDRVGGLAVPRLVREVPGAPAKVVKAG